MQKIKLNWIPKGELFHSALVEIAEETVISGHHIPEGFVTDGTSLPRVIRPFLSPFGPYFPAAVLHDYLLMTSNNRKYAAKEFKRCLKELDMPSWIVNSFYAGVRAQDKISD